MAWITYTRRPGWHYLLVRLPFHKALEVGWQDLCQYVDPPRYFDLYFRLNLRGHDHAGLKFFIQFWRVFFEFNVYDNRHWNYLADRWVQSPEEEAHVGCDTGQDTNWLHGDDANPDGLGSTKDE